MQNWDVFTDKIDGSYSGRALSVADISITQGLIFFITRSLEDNSFSHVRLLKLLQQNKSTIIERWAEREGFQSNEVNEEGMLSLLRALQVSLDDIEQSPICRSLSAMRDSYLGHRLTKEIFDRKVQKKNGSTEKFGTAEVIETAEKIIQIGHQASIIWDGGVWHSKGSSEICSRQFAALWNALPHLKEYEEKFFDGDIPKLKQ
ncbi:hypothetical protein [Pseudosulfitobacter sp. DSM 107133]|uniref:hypothetical protein n=1 Tax=Pseudosulfitobacter sp. DSM 107133 TaxID=2883100 RepID=UPI000DF23CE4|nr:hypothetical protein [Pseudosulfitobacter sp. DSM 107133]